MYVSAPIVTTITKETSSDGGMPSINARIVKILFQTLCYARLG